MAIKVEHELHFRRRGRNAGVGVLLAVLIVIVFGLTVVKVIALGSVDKFQGYDHVVQPLNATPEDAGAGQ